MSNVTRPPRTPVLLPTNDRRRRRRTQWERAVSHAVERLERRVLLAADLTYDRSASLAPFDARLTQAGGAVQLVSNVDGTVLASQPLANFTGNVTVRGSAGDDRLTFDPSLSTAPLRTIAVDGGLGADTVVFGGNLSTAGGSITVTAETITLAGNATVSTAAPTTGPAGAITLTGKTVAAAAGSKLLAPATGNRPAGDVTVAVDDSPTVGVSVANDVLLPLLLADRAASITLTGATVTGNHVDVTASAATKTRFGDAASYLDDISDQLLETLGQVTDLLVGQVSAVSGQIKVQHAAAAVTLTDTAVTAAATADVTATAAADATFNTVGVNNRIPIQSAAGTVPFLASVGYGETRATATVTLDGTTSVTAAGDVTVSSDTASAAKTTSQAVGNGRLSDSDAVDVAVSLAVALTTETSTVTTGPATRVQSTAGDVAVTAHGDSDTESSGDAQLFRDGVAGLAVGVGVDRATVTSTVNGTVIAANPLGAAAYTLAGVSTAADTVTFSGVDPDHPIVRGQQVGYAVAPGSIAIGGLTPGDTYTVADVLATNDAGDGTVTQVVRLARAATLDLDAAQVDPAATQSLARFTLSTAPSASFANDGQGNLSVPIAALTVPLVTGDVVTYVGPGSPVTEQNVAGTFARAATGDTLTRTDGGLSFTELGLHVGQQVQITNANGTSNGTFTIKAFSADGNTVTFAQANAVTAGPASGFTLTTVPAAPALVGGLTQGTPYTVTVTNGRVLFRDPANPGQFVRFTNAGAGVQGFSLLRNAQAFKPATAVDSAADTITVPNHGYRTGDLLIYHTDPTRRTTQNVYGYTSADPTTPTVVGTATKPDAPVDGLQDGDAYFVTVVDANHVRLSESSVAAADAAVIDLTTAGTGAQLFTSPDTAKGVSITATLEATNSAAAGVALSDGDQPFADAVLNSSTNAANLAAGFARAPALLDSIREAVQTKFGRTPAYGPQPQPAQDTGVPLEFSGTFAINAYDHTVLATVGPSAVIKSGRDLTVEATVEESTAVSSISEATRNGLDSADTTNTGDGRGDVEISVAFAYGDNQNTARATVSPGATTDAKGATTVNATVDYPLRSDTPEAAVNPAESIANNGLDGLSVLLDGDLGLGSNLFNGQVSTLAGDPGSADADQAAIGLGLDLQFFTNEATARVGGNALVNQDPAYQTTTQSVAVTAATTATLVDVAGTIALNLSVPGGLEAAEPAIGEGNLKGTLQSLVNPLGLSAKNVIGPAVVVTTASNTTTAEVAAGARVRTGPAGAGLTVDAEQTTFSLALAQTGAQASEFGLTASVTVDATTDVTTADIATGAVVTGGPVAVTATDTTDRFGIDGGFIKGQKIGVGTSVGVNELHRTTQAYVGSDTPDTDAAPGAAAPTINIAGALTVAAADHGSTFALALAGAVLTEPTNKATPKQPTVPTNTGNPVGGGGGVSTATGAATGGGLTIAVGASVAVNEGADTVRAFIDDPAVVASAVSVSADSDPTVRAVVVGGAIVTTKGGANQTGGTNVAVGGAVAVNELSGTVAAFVRDADVRATQTTATGPALVVSATDTPTIYSDGGGVAVVLAQGAKSPTNVSVGVGVAVNDIATAASAFIDASPVATTAGGVAVTATFSPTIDALTLGGAAAASASASGNSINIAAAGAGAGNYISGGASAYVVDSPGITIGTGDLAVTATDTAQVTVDAGGFALAASLSPGGNFVNLSIAASVAINQITDVTAAYVRNSPVAVTAGGISVVAASSATIDALTIGGALGGAGLAGAGSGNVINDTVSADVQGGPTTAFLASAVRASGPLTVSANNSPTITADGGGFGIAANLSTDSGKTTATASVGVAVAINNVTATTTAAVRDVSANVGGAATVVATSGSTIAALTVAGAVSASLSQGPAFGFAGAGAGSGNTVVATTTATIADTNAADGPTALFAAAAPVAVRATDQSTIRANAGGVALAAGINPSGGANVNVSVGASAAVNNLTPTVTASVDRAAVQTAAPVAVVATSTPTIEALTIAGAAAVAINPAGNGFGISVAGAGTGSGNRVASNTVAKVTNAATITAQGTPTANAVAVTTTDTATITARAIAGSVSLQAGQGGSVAIGVAIASNDLSTGSVLAVVDAGSTVNATGSAAITATSAAAITAVTVGVAASVSAGSSGGINLAGSGAGAQSTNTIARTVEARVTGGATVAVVGQANLTLRAVDVSTITSTSAGGSLAISASTQGLSGALAVSAGLSTDDVGNTVRAYVSGAAVSADRSIDISAIETTTVTATAAAVSGAVAVTDPTSGFAVALAGGAAQANNAVHNTVDAFADAGATVTAATALGLHAADTATIKATVPAISFAIGIGVGISIGVTLSNNTVTDLVDAYATNATLRCTGGAVAVDAAANDTVTADCTAVSITLALGGGGQGGQATTTIAGHTAATLGTGAVVTAAGDVAVTATTTAAATANNNGGGFGILNVGVVLADAAVTTATTAVVNGATVNAGSLRVLTYGAGTTDPKTSARSATAKSVAGSVSVLGGQGQVANATVSGPVSATVGAGSAVTVTGPLTVDANATSTTSADAPGGTGGGITVAALLANATTSGATAAAVSGAATVRAGSVAVTANATKSTTATILGANVSVVGGVGGKATALDSAATDASVGAAPSAAATVVTAGAATINATSSETTTAGASGGAGGVLNVAAFLADARSTGSTTAQLADNGSVSAGSLAVRAAMPTRTVRAAEANGAASIGGSFAIIGGLGVRGDATATGDAVARIGAGARVVTPTTGSVTVDVSSTTAATSQAQGGSGGFVNVSVFEAKTQVGTAADRAVTTAVIGDRATVTTGTLNVTAAGTSAASATQLSVAVSGALGVATTTAQADTYADTTAALGTAAAGPTVTAAGDVTVAATGSQSANNALTAGAGGVVLGVGTAYATSTVAGSTTATVAAGSAVSAGGSIAVRANTADATAGTNLATGTGGIISVGVTTATATSTPTTAATIANRATVSAGTDLNVAATGAGRIAADGRSDGGGVVQVGVANVTGTYNPTVASTVAAGSTVTAGRDLSVTAALVVPAAGGSTATASGGSGGAVNVSVPTARLNVTPIVTAALDAATASAGRDVTVTAASATNSVATGSTDAGGAISVNQAEGATRVTGANTAARIGPATTVTAGRNLTLAGSSNHVLGANATARNGGFAADSRANTTALLNADTRATFGAGATVTAVGLLTGTSSVTVNGRSSSSATANGFGSGAYADRDNDDGGVTITNPSTVDVAPNANLTGDAVSLRATIDAVDVRADAYAESGGLFVVTQADGRATVNAVATVNLDGGGGRTASRRTTVTGARGVDVIASVGPVNVQRVPFTRPRGIGAGVDRTPGSTYTSGFVLAENGVLVTAGTRDLATTPLTRATPTATPPQLALYVAATESTLWDADVTLTAGPAPTLVVDAAGNITTQRGLSATSSGGTVFLDDVANTGPGQVYFNANYAVQGSRGLFTFQQAYDAINISVAKGRLFVGNITPYAAAGAGVEPKVTINVLVNALEFDVANNFAATAINIADTDPNAAEFGIRMSGLIDNPIGTTTLTSTKGIYAANFANRQGVVRTNRLVARTGGDFGGTFVDETDRIPVDLVESAGRPAFASVDAGGNINVGLQALNRNPAVTSNFGTTTDPTPSRFYAGGSADIMLLGGLDQRTPPANAPYGIQVFETALVTFPFNPPAPTNPKTSPRTTLVTDHFRVSRNTAVPASQAGLFGAGSNPIAVSYDLGLVSAGSTIDIYKAAAVTSTVNVFARTDVRDGPAARNVDGSTNGFIRLVEQAGDMRVGLIRSTNDSAQVESVAGSILDVPDNNDAATGDAAADVVGVNVYLFASHGGIGTAANVLEIDSGNPRDGLVNAAALNDIFLYELATLASDFGNLNVGDVTSRGGNVSLRVQYGGVLDAANDAAADVTGNQITLRTDSGNPSLNAVGVPGNDLEIDSSFSGTGGLTVFSDGRVGITETLNELYVRNIDSTDQDSLPNVTLTTRDAPTDRNDVIVTGRVSTSALAVFAGDDFVQNADAPISAQAGVSVQVDRASTDADAFGAALTINGDVTAKTLALSGGSQVDAFDVLAQRLTGTGTPFTVDGNPPVYPTFPGDTLTVRGRGSVPVNTVTNVRTGTGFVTVPAYTTVNYTNVEQVDRGGVNDPPVNILPADFTTDQNPVVLSAASGRQITVLDADAGSANNFSVTLTPSVGTLTLASRASLAVTGAGTAVSPLVLVGTLADINMALTVGVSLALPANYNGPATVTVFSNDNGNTGTGGPLTDTDVLTINAVNAANDPPVNQLPAPIVATTTPIILSAGNGNAIGVTDVDAGDAANFLVTLTAADGTLSLASSANVAVAGTGTAAGPLTLTGTLANINAALHMGLILTTPAGFAGDTSITIVSNDRGNTGPGGPLTDTDTLGITVLRLNRPPVNTLPGNVATDAVTPVVFAAGTAISVADPDAGAAANFNVTITVTAGGLSLAAPAPALLVLGATGPSLVLTGTLADINAALVTGLVYTPDAAVTGAVTLTVVSNDAGNTGLPGPLTDTDALTITVSAVTNKPPVNALPPDVSTTVTTVTLSATDGTAISVADPDVDPAATDYRVTLTPADGTLAFADLTGVGLGTASAPFGPPSYTLVGSLAAINAVLASGVTVTLPAGFAGTTTVTVTSNDAGHSGAGGPLTDTDVLRITVGSAADINDPPVNALPPDVITAAAAVTFSGFTGNAISVADSDAGDAANFTVTLTPSLGVLTLVPTTAVTVTGAGTTTSPLVLTGMLARINASLDGGLTLTPSAGFAGVATVMVLSNDAGNTGTGGPKTDLDVLTVLFAPGSTPNQPPANRLPQPIVTDLTTIVLSADNGTAVSVTDSDAGLATNLSVSLSVTVGTLSLVSSSNITSVGDGTAATPLVLTGSLADLNAALAFGLRVVTPNGFVGTTTLTVVSNDAGNTGTGGPLTDTDSVTITVVAGPVNDPPVNALPAPVTTDATSVVFSAATGNALLVADVDAGAASNFNVTLTAATGTLALTGASAGVTATGAGTAASPLSLTGTLAAINAALRTGLRFTPPAGFAGPTSILVVSNDAGNTGSGGPKADADVLPVTFTVDVNDPPVNRLPAPVSVQAAPPNTAPTTVTLSAANGNAVSFADVDAGTTATNLAVSLSFGDGTVSLVNATGVTVAGAGTAASPLVLTGSMANLNAALGRGVKLTFNPGFVGLTLLKMVSNDAGNTGAGGPKTDIDSLAVTVTPAAADTVAPRVVAVYADSTAWSATFRDYVDGGFADPSALGYRVPTGSGQFQTLPWVNLNVLRVRFNVDVGPSLTLADFAVGAAPGWAALGVPVTAMPNMVSVGYDPATFTATLVFDGTIPAAVLDLKIVAAGVTSAAGTPLDGEWANNVTGGASGNGTPGGDFAFRLFVLPGDTRDQNAAAAGVRTVNTNDSQRVRDTQNGLVRPSTGPIGYDIRADLDGSATINSTDSLYVRNQQGAIVYPTVTAAPVGGTPVKGTPVKGTPVGDTPVIGTVVGGVGTASAGSGVVRSEADGRAS